MDRKKSFPAQDAPEEGNLIIHGDNLHALKALMPRYAGRVNCIYIDPPYNTGNEGWIYNDNVNSELMKQWLKENGDVDREDPERHDKWLCMIWPRLQLLRELLAEDGVIFISIDDNEQHRLRLVMDEIFGEENFIASVIWQRVDSPKNTAVQFSDDHDYVLVYAKDSEIWRPNLLPRTGKMSSRYKNPDNDPRGPWLLSDLAARNKYSQGRYSITTPSGRTIAGPPAGSYWRVNEEKFWELDNDGRIWWGKSGNNRPGIKRFLSDTRQGVIPQTFWSWKEAGSTRHAKQELSQIMGLEAGEDVFVTPKPVQLLDRILQIASSKDAIVLDSFAGSGSTAHAVLALNKQDGGKRKFILVECEDYAQSLTAERVRRVIKGVPKAKDEDLKNGLGGNFGYYTLGEELNIENLITGKSIPDYDALARHVAYTATGVTLEKIKSGKDYLFGETDDYCLYMIYRPDLTFLRSAESALTLDLAKRIGKTALKKNKTALVFAPWKFVSQKDLSKEKITFCQLPYAIHRLFGD